MAASTTIFESDIEGTRATASAHRKIELQSPADLTYLIANVSRAASAAALTAGGGEEDHPGFHCLAWGSIEMGRRPEVQQGEAGVDFYRRGGDAVPGCRRGGEDTARPWLG